MIAFILVKYMQHKIYHFYQFYVCIRWLKWLRIHQSMQEAQERQVCSLGWEDLLRRAWQLAPGFSSCLENPMDRGAWQAKVHGVTKSQTQLSY